MASLLAEMDARTGPIHDLVVSLERGWMDYLAQLASSSATRASWLVAAER